MPFFNNLPEVNIRGLTSSLNPMNFFNDTPASPTQAPSAAGISSPTPNTTAPCAEAGPGPSSTRTITRRNAPPPLEAVAAVGKGPSPMKSSLRPARPELGSHSESSTSIDGLPGRRKSSGTNVVILDPEVDPGKRVRKGSLMANGEAGEGRKKKKALDTYIIVKPPPTASKNPLNLQVQLVVKTGRGRDRAPTSSAFSARSTSMASVIPSSQSSPAKASIVLPDTDSSSTSGADIPVPQTDSPTRMTTEEQGSTLGADLTRSTSLKSSVSALSNKSTGTNLSTGTTGGKRIEPMFNLAVHNVMQPTVVTDAATDTKVAKFHKRQVDISGVGVLEPCEVWLPVPGANPLKQSVSGSDEGHSPPLGRTSRPLSMVSFNTPLTPTMSRNSEAKPKRASTDIKSDLKNFRDSIISQAQSPETAPKKFFGRLFKKKEPVDTSARSIHRKSISEVVIEPGTNELDTTPHSTIRASVTETHTFVGHSTFGTAPAVVYRRASDPIINPDGAVTGLTTPCAGPSLQLSASGSSDGSGAGLPYPMMPSTRPIGYTWTMKKWAKKNSESWASQLVAASAAGLDARMDDDVVFEWVKMKSGTGMSRISTRNTNASAASHGPRDRSKSRASTLDIGLDTPSQASLAPSSAIRSASPFNASLNPNPERAGGKRSPSTRSSPTRPSTPTDEISTIDTRTDDEAGYDSDPEDSETPWTCSIWVKKTNRRQLLGTLTPAPHHPKVIGILKIPVGLQAIPLCEVAYKPTTGDKVVKQKEAEKRIREQVCITEEGLKDVICVSAMWLVAREEFGGLGRKKKV